jgi:N-ethylmaleimide reductase
LEVWDEKRVGVRVSPTGTFNDMHDESLSETFTAAVERLNNYRIGYLHVVESTQDGRRNNEGDWAFVETFARTMDGVLHREWRL